jgi:molybdopterin/thiamine biosynthesis adenylyltransferase
VDRQQPIRGFDQGRLQRATVVLVGCGGINGHLAMGLVRKGLGKLILLDHDTVELSNLNRKLFFEQDLYKNKALCLARNLRMFATQETTIYAYPMDFESARQAGHDLTRDIIVIGIDRDTDRIAINNYYRLRNTPTITMAVSEDANNGYVFIQEEGGPCFGCLFGHSQLGSSCPGVPAVLDILFTIDGIALYALDTMLMNRPRNWNYCEFFLDGSIPPRQWLVKKRPGCRNCSDSGGK